VKQIFHPLVMRGVPVLVTNYERRNWRAKATTAFVATKISFINEIASLCEHVNADAVSLSLALGLDKRLLHGVCSQARAWAEFSPRARWSRSPDWRGRTMSI